MAKKKAKEVMVTNDVNNTEPEYIAKELDIKISLDKEPGFGNRIKVKVSLFKDGEEIASDYDFVTLD